MASTKLEFSRGEVIASKYEVNDLLDESPLGLTYRVKHIKSGKFVRLTMLRPKIAGADQKDALVAIFKKVRDLQDDALVKLGELDEHEGVAFYTMEEFEGSTLRELLQSYKIGGKQFAIKDAAQVLGQILDGLEHLHEAGIVMRALRPEYVLINTRYTGPRRQIFVAKVKLVGAGFWDLVPAGTLAEDEFTRGEAQYLAPELKSFDPVSSPRCDLYSAGVIFYELLTGTAPVGTFQLPGQLRPDLPSHLNDVVELALANSPDDRYRSANDLSRDVQRTFDAAQVEETPRKPIVGPLGYAVGVVLVLAVAAIVWSLVNSDQAKSDQIADQELRDPVFEHYKEGTRQKQEEMQAKHPPNMTFVPDGPFVKGRLNFDPNAQRGEPTPTVVDVPGYLIDIFEYPNEPRAVPKGGVTFTRAKALCEAAGKRLCTADEWEKACKGPHNSIYTYGDAQDDFCGNDIDLAPSGSRERCRSTWGVFDMSGGPTEWTSTPASSAGRYVVKGGLLGKSAIGTRCAFSTDENEGYSNPAMGFRCCRDTDAPWPLPAPPRDPATPGSDDATAQGG